MTNEAIVARQSELAIAQAAVDRPLDGLQILYCNLPEQSGEMADIMEALGLATAAWTAEEELRTRVMSVNSVPMLANLLGSWTGHTLLFTNMPPNSASDVTTERNVMLTPDGHVVSMIPADGCDKAKAIFAGLMPRGSR